MRVKVKVWINTGFAGVKHEDIMEFPDDATEEEINDEVLDWLFQKVEYCWEPIED